MRGMALKPVNPLQVTYMGGQDPTLHDGFVVARINNHQGKTSGGQQVTDHRGTNVVKA